MTKSGSAFTEIIDLLQGQPPIVNNGKAYSAIEARFRELREDELDGCNSCLHNCGATSCKIVDSDVSSTTTCRFKIGSSVSKSTKSTSTRGNNITMDIEDLFKSSGV
jgi:hypothetical protein